MCVFDLAWGQKDEDQEDEKLWEDNWDDDDVDANFSEQLRAEISKGSLRKPKTLNL